MKDLDRVDPAIRHRRQALNLNQNDVVARVDMNRRNYFEVENGKRNITLSTLLRIAKAPETEAWKNLKDASTGRAGIKTPSGRDPDLTRSKTLGISSNFDI